LRVSIQIIECISFFLHGCYQWRNVTFAKVLAKSWCGGEGVVKI
jgi:hypothetical protein